jgi:hypothetical protein
MPHTVVKVDTVNFGVTTETRIGTCCKEGRRKEGDEEDGKKHEGGQGVGS